MNKNLLILIGVGGVFWYLRDKSSQSTPTSSSTALNTGANAYVPATTTSPAATQGNWLATAVATVSQVPGLIKTGADAWSDIKGALHLSGAAPAVAPPTADGGNVWAGYPSADS